MSFLSWLRNRPLNPSAQGRAQRRPAVPRFRPQLEMLEARNLPSTYSAATASDLIADINAANNAGGTNTITLTAPTTSPYVLTAVNNTTNGANGLPVISGGGKKLAADNLTIVGNGDTIERSTASGTAAFRLFDVASGGSLTLESVTLQGGLAYGSGAAADGGAIYNQGTLTLSGVAVQGNTAQGSDGSGVVKINKKTYVAQPGADAAGGGIWSSGTVTLEGGTTLGGTLSGQGNRALGGRGASSNGLASGAAGGNAFGGGLYLTGGSVTVSNAVVAGNLALGGAGGSHAAFTGNGGAGGTSSGGGLYMTGGTLVMNADTVQSNRAQGGIGGEAPYAGFAGVGGNSSGGGICIATAHSALLSNVDLVSNVVQGGTGGYSNGGGAYGGNAFGGGLYVGGGTVTLTNDTVTGNAATGGYGGAGNFPTTPHDGAAGGAGIYIASGAKVSLDSYTVANTTSNYDYSDGFSKEDDIDGSYTLV